MMIKAAIVQESPVFLNLSASLEKAESAIRKAAHSGAEIIAFAECWLPGYPVWLDFSPQAALWDQPGNKALFQRLYENAVLLEGPEVKQLQALSNELDVTIVMGTHERRGGSLYNTAMTFVPRRFAPDATGPNLRRKLVPTYTERLVWGGGDGSTLMAANTPVGIVGTMICWEHWMPLLRSSFHAQNETLHIAQWPVVKDMHLVASRHYAFEGRVPVIAAGSFMTLADTLNGYRSSGVTNPEALKLLEAMEVGNDGILHSGGSTLIDAHGTLLCPQIFDKEALVIADIDPATAIQGKLTLDTNGHYSRPDIFELHVNTRPQAGVLYQDASYPSLQDK